MNVQLWLNQMYNGVAMSWLWIIMETEGVKCISHRVFLRPLRGRIGFLVFLIVYAVHTVLGLYSVQICGAYYAASLLLQALGCIGFYNFVSRFFHAIEKKQ